jgi:ubiquinone/menaquinone biosynthesis C-methylase UbiE
MKITDPQTYWESSDFESPYQMGAQKHRVYLMDMLKNRGIKTLLDVGCGTGPIYDMIVNNEDGKYDNIHKYKGTDYSRTMIETCKAQFPAGDFEVQDARDLMEEDDTWDCVLLLHCLDHLDNYKAAIAEAARVSNKYVIIVLWRGFVGEGTSLNDRNMMGKEEGEEPWKDTYLQEYSIKALNEAFEKAGLVVEEIAEGEAINSDSSHYNFLYLLRKENT